MTRKKILRISLISAVCITVFSTALLLLFPPSRTEALGTLNVTNTAVCINNTKIPSYDYDNRVFITAEDLENFGVVIIKSDEGNITLTYDSVSVNAGRERAFSHIEYGERLYETGFMLYISGQATEHYTAGGYNIIPAEALKRLPHTSLDYNDNTYRFTISADIESRTEVRAEAASAASESRIIVLDPGHGKSSSAMSEEERANSGWVYNSAKGQWGEWRHWKNGSVWTDCEGEDCNHYGSCWYPMENGDRSTEPDINLANCLSAKKYLEEMGYTVRLTRSTADENPSVTKRLSCCYPDCDTSAAPDADIFICIHSNAGGGSGSAYIELSGGYTQYGISNTYTDDGNRLGQMINNEIVSGTSLSRHSGGKIGNEGYLIAFNKSPVICGYMEIGFFDNTSDLAILQNETDKIGKAIANGVDKFMQSK